VGGDSPDVAEYIAAAPAERQPVLEAIRDLCRSELADFSEEVAHGMPAYRRDGGELELAFASQARYISLYVRSDVMEQHADRLAGLSCGKSCIRFPKPERVDLELVRSLLRGTAKSAGPVC
jgi:uncharacterized protein YdhG (YjbR/CyaY superfamily)